MWLDLDRSVTTYLVLLTYFTEFFDQSIALAANDFEVIFDQCSAVIKDILL